MGMTIDDADTILSCERLDSSMGCGASDEDIDEALGVAIDTMRKYQKLQADYENRLKADMVAMLTEIQLEIEEKQYDFMVDNDYNEGVRFGLMLAYQELDKITTLQK